MTMKQVREVSLVPFVREKSGHISVVARLSGKQARLLVDTGAGGTCIHVGALDKYKLALTARNKMGGGVGTVSMRMTALKSHDLSIQAVDLSAFKLIALDLSHVIAGLAKARVEGIIGVLGADVLHRKQAVIDYSRGVILLSR